MGGPDMAPIEERKGFFNMTSATSQDKHRKLPKTQRDNESSNPFIEMLIQQYQQQRGSTTDQKPPSQTAKLIDYLHKKFPSRVVRRVLKCTLAYFITTLFSLIHPLAATMGSSVFLVTTGSLFNHPGRSMGAQVDATVTTALGLILAVGWACAALAAISTYNVEHPATYYYDAAVKVIPALFLFVGVFLTQLLRQLLPKFNFFSLQFMIVQIFAMTRGVFDISFDWKLPLNIGMPLLIGAGISFVVNIFVWPESAVDGLGRALQETVKASQSMLQTMTDQFFLEPDTDSMPEEKVDGAAASMRLGMTKVKSAYREAKYEISYAYIRPQEVGDIRKTLERLTKHLAILGGCLKSERELFASALEVLAQELSEDEDLDDILASTNPQPSDNNSDDSSPLSSEKPRRPSLHHAFSALDADLLRAALRATNDMSTTTSPRGSPHGSRQQSRAASRRTSREDLAHQYHLHPMHHHPHDDDDDYTEENQKSITSLRSYLALPKITTTPACPPPKPKRKVKYSDRHLLMIYLERLRAPLVLLTTQCRASLDCAAKSIQTELDLDDDEDSSVRSTWLSYILHVLKLNRKKSPAAPIAPGERKDNSSSSCTNPTTPCQPDLHFCRCEETIRDAIKKFDLSERKCMDDLYKYKEEQTKAGSNIDLGLREELFLVFYFMFTLREVASELEILASQLDTLRQHAANRMVNGKRRKHLYMPQMTQKWWRKWAQWSNHQSTRDKGGTSFNHLTRHMPDENQPPDIEEEYRLNKLTTTATLRRERTRRGSSGPVPLSPSRSHNSMTLRVWTSNTTNELAKVPTVPPSSPDIESMSCTSSIDTKKQKPPLTLRFRYNLWKSLRWTTSYDFRFSLKMAVAVLVLCMPAFFPSSASWYTSVRGQWSAMTVIAILNPTNGGTLGASGWRIVGTLIGALMGWGALAAGDGSPYILATFAVILAIPFFYIHLASTYNRVGIVVLIAYMVVALARYAYPVAGESVAETVWKRVATMIVGIVVALLLNSLIWPFVARQAVRKSIPGVLDQLADYYTFLMGTFLYHLPSHPPTEEDMNRSIKMEGSIQSSIEAVLILLELTDNEPRLRGPFPKAFYKAMIETIQDILNLLASMRVSLFKMSPNVKSHISQHEYYQYRRDMIASILLHFYTLASALRTKSPMPIFMPSARAARGRLIENQQINSKTERLVNFRNLTWFAMSCCTEEIISELEHLSNLVQFVVGEAKFAHQAQRIDVIQSAMP
ncbi:hypothetical protein DM01DRAFT_1382683 [Hesseltinella vesiculosa]|uniref:DUF2421 domain-containing protein n=1 Tax=Hesseltinella vesiculosa TaxID=101127 RepID=A0A1X2GL58_9FUNG|nr:hypothetical protein DM01DRAFT_1382683 [Hesseltinella vesiculosa]